MSDFKQGNNFLCPVTLDPKWRSAEFAPGTYAHMALNGVRWVLVLPSEIETLIPADRLTDLETENARLREALDVFMKGDKWKARAVEAMIKKVNETLDPNP